MAASQASWTLRLRLDGMTAVVPREASQARRSLLSQPLSPTISADHFRRGRHGRDALLRNPHIVGVPGVSSRTQGRPFASQTALSLVFRSPRVWPIPLAKAPLLRRQRCGGP